MGGQKGILVQQGDKEINREVHWRCPGRPLHTHREPIGEEGLCTLEGNSRERFMKMLMRQCA